MVSKSQSHNHVVLAEAFGILDLHAFKFSGGTWAAHRFVSFAYRTGIWGRPILE